MVNCRTRFTKSSSGEVMPPPITRAKASESPIAPSNQAQTAPVTDLTPTVTNDAQNILSQWLGEFDNWFYGVSGVRLSGIFYVLLNAIAWTLGLAQQVVNWLLGLFR